MNDLCCYIVIVICCLSLNESGGDNLFKQITWLTCLVCSWPDLQLCQLRPQLLVPLLRRPQLGVVLGGQGGHLAPPLPANLA